LYGIDILTEHYFVSSQRTRLTDGQTERRQILRALTEIDAR